MALSKNVTQSSVMSDGKEITKKCVVAVCLRDWDDKSMLEYREEEIQTEKRIAG